MPGLKSRCGLVLLLVSTITASAVRAAPRDYWQPQRAMVARGVQAMLMCNGLFTSQRTLEQVFGQELAYLPAPVGTAAGGDYRVREDLKAVEVGVEDATPVMRAAYRDGFGCVALAPEQTLAEIDTLPRLSMPSAPGEGARIAWPDGDLPAAAATPSADIDAGALAQAADWSFNRPTPEQITLSLLVVHRGQIVLERYAPGVDMYTRTRTWSTAKSIAVTLIGMLVDQGRMALDEPNDFAWLPPASGSDPRRAITLRHLLNMSSGLYPVDNAGLEYATGSGLSYWAGASAVQGALSRGLVREPGTSWDYENYDTLTAVHAMRRALGADYHEFPRRALLDRIGMRNTLIGVDRFGDFILSSQVYANARDLARFGLLYLNGGMWNGERLLSQRWIDFVRTPAPASAANGHDYGGQWWLVPDQRDDVPRDAYSTRGNRGQYVIVVPSRDLVIVRRGLDWGAQGFDNWDLAREVLKAFPQPRAPSTPGA